ncbi:MAG: hypothetical protein OXE86_01470 [Alphaproteobacteria bacterium]|nr:hypothetical protein [Alphaproteobacteria bacterium]
MTELVVPRAIPFRSHGLDLGNSDFLALAQVQELKQANLIEGDLPQREPTGASLCEMPKVSLSGFDERRGPISLYVVGLCEQFFEHDVSPRCGRPHRVRQVFRARKCCSQADESQGKQMIRSSPQHMPPDSNRGNPVLGITPAAASPRTSSTRRSSSASPSSRPLPDPQRIAGRIVAPAAVRPVSFPTDGVAPAPSSSRALRAALAIRLALASSRIARRTANGILLAGGFFRRIIRDFQPADFGAFPLFWQAQTNPG